MADLTEWLQKSSYRQNLLAGKHQNQHIHLLGNQHDRYPKLLGAHGVANWWHICDPVPTSHRNASTDHGPCGNCESCQTIIYRGSLILLLVVRQLLIINQMRRWRWQWQWPLTGRGLGECRMVIFLKITMSSLVQGLLL